MQSPNVLSVHDARMPESVHWVLVADAGRAQIFAADLMMTELLPLETHVATRDHHGRHRRDDDAHTPEADRFARELADVLKSARVEHRYERLVLVAPPTFLGTLRSHLDPETTRRVLTSVHHEWTRLGAHELTTRVRDALPTTASTRG